MSSFPYLGFGLGLRPIHFDTILTDKPAVDWFEAMSEDYMIEGGNPLYYLTKIREQYPLVLHGVSMSIGSMDPVDKQYLQKLKTLIERVQPIWVSDHLCWTGVNGLNMHDLLPLPYTEEAIDHVVAKIIQVQDFLGRQILLENVSSYVTYNDSEMTEWQFLSHVAERADCKILLDINNIYVSGFNNQFDPLEYLRNVPKTRVQQFHIAGHSNKGTHIIDTHDATIISPVWDLYRQALRIFPPVSTMIERDENIPPINELLNELNQAKEIAKHEQTQNNTTAVSAVSAER